MSATGSLLELILARDVEPAGIDGEAFDRFLAEAPALQREFRLVAMLQFEHGAEDARQIADILRDQEVMLHEALDAARAGVIAIAHADADLALAIEGQAILGAAGEEMEMAAHRPEEILRPRETLRLFRRQHFEIDELVDVVGAIDVFRDPEQRMEIAQPALAFLDVGLDEVARIAQPLVALIALGELGLDELRRALARDLGIEAPLQLGEELLIAPDVARLEHRGADGEIALGLADGLLDRARRLPDFEAEIPERVEQIFDHLLGMRRALVGREEEQIDVGEGRELAAAIAADGDQREPLAGGRIGVRIDVARDEIVERADDLIDEEAERVHGLGAARTVLEALAHLGAAGRERGFQRLGDALAIGLGAALGDRFELRRKRTAIDDVALARDFRHAAIVSGSG